MGNSPLSELRAVSPTLSVGVLTGGESALNANVQMLEREGVRLVHVDVMDGRFCPVEAGGVDAVASIATTLLKDVHLMIDDPIDHVAEYARSGADVITVHVETRDPAATLRAISELPNQNVRGRTLLRGLAVLPATPLGAVTPFLDLVDILVVLAVTPGAAGVDSSARERLASAHQLAQDRDLLVSFDGGVRPDDVAPLIALGADLIVSGSAIFGGDSPPSEVLAMMQAQLAG